MVAFTLNWFSWYLTTAVIPLFACSPSGSFSLSARVIETGLKSAPGAHRCLKVAWLSIVIVFVIFVFVIFVVVCFIIVLVHVLTIR